MPRSLPLLSSTPVDLRILATSDLHCHIRPWDYLADRPAPHGLALLATLIARQRGLSRNSLLFDNGDFLQGSPLGEDAPLRSRAIHPMIAAMNHLRYDAATLGNHEFSHGLPFLRHALSRARFPLVSANLSLAEGALLPDHVLLARRVTDRDGQPRDVTIAVTGFAPPQTPLWEAMKLNGKLQAQDILTAARDVLARLREKADLVIALAHTGLGGTDSHPMQENAGLSLAGLDGLDVLVLGHTHLRFPPPQPDETAPADALRGKPAVMPGFHGSDLGVIDLTLVPGESGWRVAGHRTGLLPASAEIPPAPALLRLSDRAHRATMARLRQPLGESLRPLTSHFALVAPSAMLHLIAAAQADHMRPLVPPDLRDLPLLSSVAPFRTGGRGGPDNFTALAAGPLLRRHVADLYLHPNTPVLLRLTGAEIADWLERAAALFNRIAPGSRDAPLIRPDIPGFDFEVIDALSFTIDLSVPPRFDPRGVPMGGDAQRIRDLRHGTTPIAPSDQVLLVTNSYRAGGASFPGTDRAPLATGTAQITDLIARHIAAKGRIDPHPPGDWRFAPMGGTTVTFDTAPEARADDPAASRYAPEPLGVTPQGFQRFRLTL